MQEIAVKFQVLKRMRPGDEGYDSLRREVLSGIASMTPGKFSEFCHCFPQETCEDLPRPSEAKEILYGSE